MVEDKFPTEQYQILQNNEFELVATESSPQRPGARSIVINKRTGELLWSNLLACAQQSAARVHALRAAGLQILREIEGRPTRVIVDLETLLAKADGIERGLRGGFFEKAPPVPPRAAPRRTAEEERELQRTWEDVMRKIDEAVARTLAADAAAVAKSDDDEAA